jgi:hypothetical protein
LEEKKSDIDRLLSRRLRWQFRVLAKVLEGRQETLRRKVEVIREELDEGEGI